MQPKRKCSQCNVLNDGSLMFCVNCGKYLRGKIKKNDDKLTVWGIDETPGKDFFPVNQPEVQGVGNNRKIAICPQCEARNNADNDMLPLSCSVCGYYFQVGVDKIMNECDQMEPNVAIQEADNSDHVITDSADIRKDPLKSVAKDTSSLRITMATSDKVLPELMKESGNIIGKNGTVFRSFVSEKQVSIWHTFSGWYARAVIGVSFFNGVPMNQGVQVKLSSGDLLAIDQEQFMMEIF